MRHSDKKTAIAKNVVGFLEEAGLIRGFSP
jgi:hypothetical protein